VIALGRAIRTARTVRDDQRGLSLPELIVAIMVTLVLLGMVFTFFLIGSRTIASTRSASLDSGVASNMMNEISRVIRSGTPHPVVGQPINDPPFLAATRESFTIYSFVDTPVTAVRPIIVQFSLDANRNLIEKRWAASGTSGDFFTFAASPGVPPVTAPTSTRRLGGPVALTATGQPQLFTFLSASGAMTMPTAGIAPADLPSIVSVQVDVRVNTATGTVSIPIEMRNVVLLPNLGT
jgi:prepilin-type N-terminal cleavage/methylation domain-containing protein